MTDMWHAGAPQFWRRSPVTSVLAPLMGQARWRVCGGVGVPAAFSSRGEEEASLRTGAAFTDRSWLSTYLVSGAEAARLLDRVQTRDVSQLQVGHSMRTAAVDDEGRLIDLCTVYRLEEDVFQLAGEVAIGAWLARAAAHFAVALEETTGSLACLQLVGPAIGALLDALGAAQGDRLAAGAMELVEDGSLAFHLCRRGPGTPDAYEMWFSAVTAEHAMRRLLALGETVGLRPVGADAFEALRIATGQPRAFAEFEPAILARERAHARTPFACGAGGLVDLDKPFSGRRALLAAARAPAPRPVRLAIEGFAAARGQSLRAGASLVGVLTSAAVSPSRGASLALGFLDAEPAPGAALEAVGAAGPMRARILGAFEPDPGGPKPRFGRRHGDGG
ncbi:MAG: aminomethyl transferase family protein [Alphaproteobacteria bacterium]|nr:aminomethyl transferase family protein [Alphaproteobacteria bacterium]